MITRPIRYLVVIFLLGGILFSLDKTGLFRSTSNAANRLLVGPTVRTGASVANSSFSFFESIFSLRSIISESKKAEEERDYFRGEYFKLKAVEEENDFLREALSIENSPQKFLVLAKITSFDPLRPSQLAIINKGKEDGIRPGNPVILAGRVLVGIIEEVNTNTSRVSLITSENSRIVTRLERSGTNASISGSASGALILDLVLPETDLAEGEIIVSSGIEGDIPKNLLVGEVSKVISEETASFKKAVVRPFFSARDLGQVFVITN